MKRRIAILFALLLLLCGLSALAEAASGAAPALVPDQRITDIIKQDAPAGEDGEVETVATANGGDAYRVYVTDADGNPVAGAMIQFCDENTCTFQPTDADGLAEFRPGEQKVYEVHVLKAPEGFRPDETIYNTLDVCSDVTILLEQAE